MPSNTINIVTFSWNVQKYGKSKSLKANEIARHAAKSISNAEINNENRTRYVGFLLEIGANSDACEELLRSLETELEKMFPKRAFVVGATDKSGSKNTSERIVYFHDKISSEENNCRVDELKFVDGIKSGLAERASKVTDMPEIKEVTSHSLRASTLETKFYNTDKPEKLEGIKKTLGFKTLKQSQLMLRSNPKTQPEEWYRSGCIVELDEFKELSISKPQTEACGIKIASAHLPGPKYTDDKQNNSIILKSFFDAAQDKSVDIITGDLNAREVSHSSFEDKSEGIGGTTYSKKTGRLGKNQWDRVMARKSETFDIVTHVEVNHIPGVDSDGSIKKSNKLDPEELSDHAALTSVHQVSTKLTSAKLAVTSLDKVREAQSVNGRRGADSDISKFEPSPTIKKMKLSPIRSANNKSISKVMELE